jgi:hypothetical protein
MGAFWLALGSALMCRTEFLVSSGAKLNRRIYGDDSVFYRVFDKTPFGWFQRVVTGLRRDELQRKAIEAPGELIELLIFARVIGFLAVLCGIMVTAAGVVELVG